MKLKKQFEDKIFDMEKVAMAFDIEPFDIYFLGSIFLLYYGQLQSDG